ncbi:glycosyl transferase [Burkholderia ubonensis]|uniref:MraY family glycosyltransferase n=1 Tax=Burkholderia ubonensis TaxID=101571 RepID=UPI000755B9BB|nr:glycosyltransferase [Burkholderia ubonensis]KVO53718.1 glycosyl transferase [Burkholderia ubonensis]
MLNFVVAMLASLLITVLIIRYHGVNQRFAGVDFDMQGVQKFHVRPVPRIGGAGILFGVVVSIAVLLGRYPTIARDLLYVCLCGAPAFLSGFAEDVTKRVSARARLFCTMFAAGLGYGLLDIAVTRTSVPPVDFLLSYPIVAGLITVVAVAGLANAVNIIDGFNGLASMVSIMMFASLAYTAFEVHDEVVMTASLMMMGAVLGFFVWNFPAGLIFLGDGGAYFLGFMLAELSIVLVQRNPQVSAWYPILLFMYPIFETCFSIYRKKLLRGMSPGLPDGVHLHMLVYKRIMRWVVGTKQARELTQRNSFTSPYLWLLCLLAVGPATLFWRNTVVLFTFVVLFAVMYVWIYACIVRFKVPRWIVVRVGRPEEPRTHVSAA